MVGLWAKGRGEVMDFGERAGLVGVALKIKSRGRLVPRYASCPRELPFYSLGTLLELALKRDLLLGWGVK